MNGVGGETEVESRLGVSCDAEGKDTENNSRQGEEDYSDDRRATFIFAGLYKLWLDDQFLVGYRGHAPHPVVTCLVSVPSPLIR